jgi:hypothetical protein
MPVYELEESTWEPIPDDTVLNAEITEIKETTKNFGDGDVPRVEFKFIVREAGSDFDARKLWGDTPKTFTTDPRCRLRVWAQEILGQQLPEKFKLDTDQLVGLMCRIVVGLRTYEKNGETISKNFVTDVMRTKADGTTYEEPF